MWKNHGKRFFDVIFAAVCMLAFSPLLILLTLLVRLKLGAPVFFVQERPGYGGKIFRLVKFRTMSDAIGPDGQLRPDKDRLTPFGKFLRESSLDELPELWNVLKGEMSLVGPRPLLTQYLELYSPEQARRHEVRPGLTGLAQISGRNSISWDEKFQLDVKYVETVSSFLDMKIILNTIVYVSKRKDINAPGNATMPPFTNSLNK